MKNKKKSNKQKEKLVEGDFTQALDYSYVLSASYYDMMTKCRVVREIPEVKEAFEEVIDGLVNLYQIIGKNSL